MQTFFLFFFFLFLSSRSSQILKKVQVRHEVLQLHFLPFLPIKCEVVINSQATVLQSRLTACYLELIQILYTETVEERVMGELIFNFVMTLPGADLEK